MTGDRLIRSVAAGAVLMVAAIAAAVSFVHIYDLAAAHGQDRLAAMLTPLSIDGTILAASMAMLRAARSGLPVPWLDRLMLAVAVLATVAANVTFGAAFGVIGALISGWPALAFTGCAEMAITMVRRARPEPVASHSG